MNRYDREAKQKEFDVNSKLRWIDDQIEKLKDERKNVLEEYWTFQKTHLPPVLTNDRYPEYCWRGAQVGKLAADAASLPTPPR